MYGEAKLKMDCYIIASTLEGGWGFNILYYKDRERAREEDDNDD
jgi:hypothetical protein